MKRKINWLNHIFNFLAVILGVYLAFVVNERAKVNQDRSESAVLMTSLVSDLEKDIQVYEEYQIPENTLFIQNVEELLTLISSGETRGIEEQIATLLQVDNYTPTESTYSSMKLSGKLRLIEDLDLRKSLTRHYDGLVVESRMKGSYQVDYYTNEILSWLTDHVDLKTMTLRSVDDLTTFTNKLIIYGSLIEQKVESYKMIVEDSKSLKEEIASLLGSKT